MNIPLPKVNKMQKIGRLAFSLDLAQPQFPPSSGSIGYEFRSNPAFGSMAHVTVGPARVGFHILRGTGETIEGLISRVSKAGARAFRL